MKKTTPKKISTKKSESNDDNWSTNPPDWEEVKEKGAIMFDMKDGKVVCKAIDKDELDINRPVTDKEIETYQSASDVIINGKRLMPDLSQIHKRKISRGYVITSSNKFKITWYELSRDSKGLNAYFDDDTSPGGESYYHIHSNELNKTQTKMRDKFIKEIESKNSNEKKSLLDTYMEE